MIMGRIKNKKAGILQQSEVHFLFPSFATICFLFSHHRFYFCKDFFGLSLFSAAKVENLILLDINLRLINSEDFRIQLYLVIMD